MNALELKESLKEFQSIATDLAKQCMEFCKDENRSVGERWEVFKDAPNKSFKPFQEIPDARMVGMDGDEFSPYDDWYLDRHQTFDVVERIEDWERDMNGTWKNGWVQKLSPDILDKWKNYYMVRYIGSWKHDW